MNSLHIIWDYTMARFPTFLLITCRHLLTCVTNDAHIICLCQERLCDNGGYETKYGHFKLSITFFVYGQKVQNIKCGLSYS